jgi:hypothetical protein
MQLISPEWRVILLDLSDQEIMDISAITSFDLELKLNDTSTLAFDLDLVEFEKRCLAIGAEPQTVLYPQKTEIKVYLEDKAMFGGIISTVDSSYEGVNATLTCSADSYLHYFSKRFVSKTYVATDRSAIAWDAINTVQTVTNGDLGVTKGSTVTIFNSDLTCDYRDVKSIIQLYTYAQPTTYDFEITPDKVFNTYTRLGSDRTDVELVYPQNIQSIKVPRSADTLFNKIIGLGSGSGIERKESIQQDATSQINYRVLEKKESFNSVEIQTTLDHNTQGKLEESREVLVLPEVVPQAGVIDLTVVGVGDSIRVKLQGSTYNNDVDAMLRIYGMKIKVDKDNVQDLSLDFYKPDAGGGLEEGA